MAEEAPKSALELAMERLKKQDKEAGIEERPLTDAQKSGIAEARSVYEARVAEREILHQSAMRRAQAMEEIEKLQEELRRDKERFANDRDAKIAEIRKANAKKSR